MGQLALTHAFGSNQVFEHVVCSSLPTAYHGNLPGGNRQKWQLGLVATAEGGNLGRWQPPKVATCGVALCARSGSVR